MTIGKKHKFSTQISRLQHRQKCGKKRHLRVRRALSIYKWRRFASPRQGTQNKKRKAEK